MEKRGMEKRSQRWDAELVGEHPPSDRLIFCIYVSLSCHFFGQKVGVLEVRDKYARDIIAASIRDDKSKLIRMQRAQHSFSSLNFPTSQTLRTMKHKIHMHACKDSSSFSPLQLCKKMVRVFSPPYYCNHPDPDLKPKPNNLGAVPISCLCVV